jgi:hypothetical protein
MNTQDNSESVPPEAVLTAIREAFPKDAEKIIASLRYHSGDGFWSFERHGQFVGVERSGYIHT